MMSKNIAEVNDLTAVLTETDEFNYISENTNARTTLFTICSLSTYLSKADQSFISENKDKFDELFS